MSKRNFNPCFYVVTRNGRRASPTDNWTYSEAQTESQSLRKVLRKWGDSDAKLIEIVKTSDHSTIY